MALATRQLDPIGIEIVDASVDTLLGDPSVPGTLLALLERHGVLVFRGLGLDDAHLLAFARRLGEPVVKDQKGWSTEHPGVFTVSLDEERTAAAYMKGTFEWHIDETFREFPIKATLLTAVVLANTGGDTQFASTYAAYDRFSDEERTRFDEMKVWHSLEATLRRFDPNPAPEILERINKADPPRLHPLVWTHRDGRKSLVIGTPTSHIDGMPDDEGAALLQDLLDRSTRPEHVYTHQWGIGDLVIWDNRGVLHRATPYATESGREMHRVTLEGDERIQ